MEDYGEGTHVVLRRGERMMLDRFLTIKHEFSGASPESQFGNNPIPLPQGIGDTDDARRNIKDSQLIITP